MRLPTPFSFALAWELFSERVRLFFLIGQEAARAHKLDRGASLGSLAANRFPSAAKAGRPSLLA